MTISAETIRENLRRALAAFDRTKRIAHAWREVYDTPAGKLVIDDMLRASGILSVAFEPGDPHRTSFNDGRRSIGLHACNRLRWSESEMVALAEEQTSERLSGEGA